MSAAREIVVRRAAGVARFPLEGVREARRATRDDLRGALRIWGSGGLFGYYGLFRTSRLGQCTWYVTNRKNAVVVVTDRKTALFSPDDVEGFLAAIRAEAPVIEQTAPRPIEPARFRRVPLIAGLGIAALALGAVAFGLLYSPGAPRLTVTPTSLEIHDRFYPVTVGAASVDVSGIRVVDISAADCAWQPRERTNGFSNSHYHSGWYRARNGTKARMYWTNATRLVLLPPKDGGVPILVEVQDPDEFATRLRQEWIRIE